LGYVKCSETKPLRNSETAFEKPQKNLDTPFTVKWLQLTAQRPTVQFIYQPRTEEWFS